MADTSDSADERGGLILVVDDEDRNRELLRDLLEVQGHEVVEAENGGTALEVVRNNPPDVILLDVMMPVMDGYEVCQRLKDDMETAHIPVIMVTALQEREDRIRGIKAGANDFLTKPIDKEDVILRVRNTVYAKSLQDQVRDQNLELHDKNEQLEEAARLREDVERITKHDLKNPLQVIIGAPDVIKLGDNLTEQQNKMLESIRTSGYRMLDMVDRSLDLYKMETGVYNYEPTSVDLVQVVNKILVEMERLASNKELELNVVLDEEPVAEGASFNIESEDLLCYSLLANLIKNAIEASPDGEKIKISLQSGGQPRVAVHNQGVVPESIRERFFEKYATEGKQKGTGLGTYSALLMASTMGGEIAMETGEAAGTTITVQLTSV
ncbi:response regulator [Gemmatimonadota bacterium]